MGKYRSLLGLLFLSAISLVYADQKIPASSISADRFDRDGFVVLRKFFYRAQLREWRNFSVNYFQEIFRLLYEKGHTSFALESQRIPPSPDDNYATGHREYAMQAGKHNGFEEIVMRSPGRYELSMIRSKHTDFQIPTIQPLLDQLSPIIPSLLHVESMEDINIDYSMIVTTPQAAEQGWHSDGDHYRLDEHMHCHVLNVFIPLVDVTEERGPTEIFPQSHFQTRAAGGVRLRNDELSTPVAPTLKTGDILIFYYRVIHRGKPNFSDSNRPVLVLTLSLKWFQDEKNWPPRSLYDEPSSSLSTRSEESTGKGKDDSSSSSSLGSSFFEQFSRGATV